ncbi:hypothetical protein TELCIR_15267 [Teladorsagia circumcincta]|uniref:Reverse transcriptase domain-containing protein n=1 Tax=Teladorsagia circumcincta TaxID=45464 RepID=A0A2G9TYX4_TELCI|nr:hypothetical protein TELCIR_15267 [Teladorsagia circumcincta]
MFADDIVLIGNDSRELEKSLEILSNASRSIGLGIHPGKTKWMKNNFTRDYCLRMKGSVIEEVPSYVYLNQAITMDNDLTIEIGRRRKAELKSAILQIREKFPGGQIASQVPKERTKVEEEVEQSGKHQNAEDVQDR